MNKKCEYQQQNKNYREEPRRNYGANEYYPWTESSLEEFSRRLKQAEEIICKLEDVSSEIMTSEKRKWRGTWWDFIKEVGICTIRVLQRERRGTNRLFDKIMSEKFLSPQKEADM